MTGTTVPRKIELPGDKCGLCRDRPSGHKWKNFNDAAACYGKTVRAKIEQDRKHFLPRLPLLLRPGDSRCIEARNFWCRPRAAEFNSEIAPLSGAMNPWSAVRFAELHHRTVNLLRTLRLGLHAVGDALKARRQH